MFRNLIIELTTRLEFIFLSGFNGFVLCKKLLEGKKKKEKKEEDQKKIGSKRWRE